MVHLNAKALEGGFELHPCAAHVARRLDDFELAVGRDLLAGFGCLLAVYQNLSSQDEGLRFLAGVGELAGDQELIEPGLHFTEHKQPRPGGMCRAETQAFRLTM